MIRIEDHARVRLILLDGPPANTLTFAMLEALGREAAAADKDESVRAILIASALPKYFSPGLDLDEILALPPAERVQMFSRIARAHRALASASKPTAAAMGGASLLGGFVLALGCDWRWLSESGKVSLSEIRLGLTPGPALLGLACAMTGKPGLIKELVLQGKTLKAQEALEAGLVDALLPEEGFLEAALREAQKLAKLPPKAYASVKRSLRKVALPDEEAAWREAQAEFAGLFEGPEAAEGLLAMKEKRRPKWD